MSGVYTLSCLISRDFSLYLMQSFASKTKGFFKNTDDHAQLFLQLQPSLATRPGTY